MHSNVHISRTEAPSIVQLASNAMRSCALCGADKACLPELFHTKDAHVFDKLIMGKRRISRNSSLCQEHDKFNMLYVVRFGQFKVLNRDPTGMLRVMKFYMAGDVIGMDAIASGSHTVRVMALENSEVCEISYLHLRRAMSEEPQFVERFLRTMSSALVDRYERSSLLSLASLDERFASFLLDLSEKYGRQGYSSRAFRLSMSRSDIGSYLGTTVETVSRLIARFNAQHGVSINGRLVEVIDRKRLQAVLESDAMPRSPPVQSPLFE
ncbi:MAG: helix-turn-helix domain-containing protein [Massilia sp.]